MDQHNQGQPTISSLATEAFLQLQGPIHILAWTAYTDYDQEYQNSLNAIAQYTTYSLVETTTTDPGTLATLLADAHVFLIPEQESGNYYTLYNIGTTWAGVLSDFVNSGGTVVAMDHCNPTTGLVEGAALMDLTYDSCWASDNIVQVVVPDHPLAEGVPMTFTGRNGVGYYSYTSGQEIVHLPSLGRTVVATQDIGPGHVVMIGFDFYSYNDDMARLLANAVQWYGDGDVRWLSEEPISGTVPSESATSIQITFDASGMQPASYTARLVVESNDPVSRTISIPLTMTVLPTANMGWVEGTVTDARTGDPLEAAIVALGQPYTVTTNADTGYYKLWLDAGSYTVQVSTEGYVTETAEVSILAQGGTPRDWTLVLDVPQMEVSPLAIDVTQPVGSMTTEMMSIANDGPGNLTFEITAGSLEAASLEDLLDGLNLNYQAVIDAIPNRYDFSGGETGDHISDGGGDMYDGGNYLSTDLGRNIDYADDTIVDSTYFGTNGRYFTRKYPGLFVLVADMQDVDFFEISGNLGADGSGQADGTILQTDSYGVTYYGFVKRVYNAGDPSVNHLIIVPENPSADHTFSSSTDSDFHQVYNLSGNNRLYYLLYAGSNGYYIDDSATLNIMETFLEAVGDAFAAPWLSVAPVSGDVPAQGSVPVQVTLDASGIWPGIHTGGISIRSNDPVTPAVSIPVTMVVEPGPAFLPLILNGND